jgi:hypothetical protein
MGGALMSDIEFYRQLPGVTVHAARITAGENVVMDAGTNFEVAANEKTTPEESPNIPVQVRMDDELIIGRVYRMVYNHEGEFDQILVIINRGDNNWLIIFDKDKDDTLWHAQQFYLVIPAGTHLRPLWA